MQLGDQKCQQLKVNLLSLRFYGAGKTSHYYPTFTGFGCKRGFLVMLTCVILCEINILISFQA